MFKCIDLQTMSTHWFGKKSPKNILEYNIFSTVFHSQTRIMQRKNAIHEPQCINQSQMRYRSDKSECQNICDLSVSRPSGFNAIEVQPNKYFFPFGTLTNCHIFVSRKFKAKPSDFCMHCIKEYENEQTSHVSHSDSPCELTCLFVEFHQFISLQIRWIFIVFVLCVSLKSAVLWIKCCASTHIWYICFKCAGVMVSAYSNVQYRYLKIKLSIP